MDDDPRAPRAAFALALLLGATALIRLVLAVEKAGRPEPPAWQAVRLDPHRASADELGSLPGLGPARAEALLRAREAGARWERVEDLEEVTGIGPATVEALRPHLEFPPSGELPQAAEDRGAVLFSSARAGSSPAAPPHER